MELVILFWLIVILICVIIKIIVKRYYKFSSRRRRRVEFKIFKPHGVYDDTTAREERMPERKTSNEEIIKFIQISREEQKKNKK